MAGLLDILRSLWESIAYAPVAAEGPEGAFVRAVGVAVAGEGLAAVADAADARELLARALDPDHTPGSLRYPGVDRLVGERPGRLGIGVRLLGEELVRAGAGPGDSGDEDLMIGTVLPVPGPGRRPVIEETRYGFEGGEEAFAEVVYGYLGGVGTHSLYFYRDAEGTWRLDLVRALLQTGTMQEALGEVQKPGCANERDAFEV